MSQVLRSYRRFLICWFAGVMAFAGWIQFASPAQDGFTSPLQLLHPAYFGVYASTLAIVPLVLYVRPIATAYGGWSSAVGCASWALGVGALSYGIGNLIWTLYELQGRARPFPSWADIGYLGLLPFMLIALISMARLLHVRGRDLGLVAGVFVLGLLAIGMAIWSIAVAGSERDGSGAVLAFADLLNSGVDALTDLATFVSIVYIQTGAILLAMAFMLAFYARRAAAGMFFVPTLLIAVSCAVQFSADVTFSIRSADSAYYNGDISDVIYFFSMFTLQVAIYRFGCAYQRMHEVAGGVVGEPE